MATIEITESQAKAMQALFDLHEALQSVSINELEAVLEFAVADGLELFQVDLAMCGVALDSLRERTNKDQQ